MKLNDFPLLDGLVQDPMHVLLEGVVRKELAILLNRYIYEKHLFTLQWLNMALTGFPYSYLHSSTRPEPLEKKQIDGTGSIKQTSSATLTMVRVLPFVIGSRVPQNDGHWANYLRLLQIVLLCTSSYCSSETFADFDFAVSPRFQEIISRCKFYPKDALHVALS